MPISLTFLALLKIRILHGLHECSRKHDAHDGILLPFRGKKLSYETVGQEVPSVKSRRTDIPVRPYSRGQRARTRMSVLPSPVIQLFPAALQDGLGHQLVARLVEVNAIGREDASRLLGVVVRIQIPDERLAQIAERQVQLLRDLAANVGVL